MHKFIQFLIFLSLLVFSNQVLGQSEYEIIRIDYPKYIPTGISFNVSTVIKFNENESDAHKIELSKKNFLKVKSVYINYGLTRKQLNFQSRKNKISLSIIPEKFDMILDKPYQIIFVCSVHETLKINDQLFWNGKSKNNNIDKNAYPDLQDNHNLIDVYKSAKSAGKEAHFVKNGNLKIDLKRNENYNSIYTEFWLKSDVNSTQFFTITDQITEDEYQILSKNSFGFLSILNNTGENINDDIYIGYGGWNYFGVLISEKFGSINFDLYLNTNLVANYVFDELGSISNLSFNFSVIDSKSSFELERLKIWNYNNSLKLANREMHFLNYEADSSKLLYSTNFDEEKEFANGVIENNYLTVKTENLSFEKSDAPIFSRAPKLTVTMGNSYNSIVWYVQEFSQAKEFVLEKAIKNGSYNKVYNVFADDDPLKIYYFTDEILDENEVAFYRVKQINKDGSEVLSPEVKIGHNNITEFTLGQNYPNPFNPVTNIYVNVIIPSKFEVKVYDLVGNVVDNLFKGYLPQGLHTFEFDGSNLPSGIYFYEVLSPKAQIVKKMILAK